MTPTQPQITDHKHQALRTVITRSYNTAASCRRNIIENSIPLLRKLNAGRIRHLWAMETLEVGRKSMLDRILNTRDCADNLLKLDTRRYSEESRNLQAEANRLMQGPLQSVSRALGGEALEFQKWEEATLKLLENLENEAEELRGYLVELASQAQGLGVKITWWGNPEDNEAKVEDLEEGEILEL
ncbi:hypothetical protein L873DRAFT_1800438 [Choiromyces venosus 120613-1]|uniref:Uncharacterized protein n=1 Tax=Choiromyces venosus 120613-1 TaxID=1336337 RepID=A0A3N4JZU7_9PEZI|nr:hypothetical protein L873DRAFT_1800438 [Choiromyces venosus 120613-1]